MDFSPWDIADSFRLHEAACLIVGVMPLSKRFPGADEIPATAKPVLKKLYTGYYFGTMLDASEAIDSPQNPKEKWLFGIAADSSEVGLVWKHPRGAIRKGVTTLDIDAMILGHLKHAMVSRSELHRWVKAMGIKSAYQFAPAGSAPSAELSTQPAQSPTKPAPVMAALVEPADKSEPAPVATGAMADSFAGLHWDGEQWKKKLGDMTVWLEACLVLNRGRGEGPRLWNPVLIGAYLVQKEHAKTNSVRARFQTQPALIPWLDEWKTYEADNHPTD